MKTYVIKDQQSNKNAWKQIALSIVKPIENSLPFMSLLSNTIDTDTQQQFRNQGQGGGKRKIPSQYIWKPLSSRSIGKLRSGTDGSKTRRYSSSSKALQASGGFRKSFKPIGITKDKLKYGTNHELAGKIGSKPFRPVLFVTNEDEMRYNRLFKKYIDKGIKF